MQTSVVPADELELLWTRIAVEVDLRNPHPLRLQGTSQLWVVPRLSEGNGAGAIRLHCRQCVVASVTVNGAEAKWELLDPHEEIVCNTSLAGDGDAFDACQRAAWMVAAEGELSVVLPESCKDFNLPEETMDPLQPAVGGPDSEAWARASRSHALQQVRSKLAATRATPYLIEVKYSLESPCGGFRVLSSASGEPVLYTSGGGAYGSCVGVDYDGARCRWPCLDGAFAHHQAPVDLLVTSSSAHSLVASGQPISTAQCAPPSWIQQRGAPPAGLFTTSAWFVGPHCPLRGVGFALGAPLQRFSSVGGPSAIVSDGMAEEGSDDELGVHALDNGSQEHPAMTQWVVAGEESLSSERVGHAVSGLDAAALFVGDLLRADFPAPSHTQVWLPCDRPGSLADDTLVFANLVLVSARLAIGVRHADPQLPSHLTQLRAALLAWLLPLWKLRHAAADGWLAPGLAGWLVLRWIERALGYDAGRLALQRLHDSVVAHERGGCLDAPPVSRGASFAAGRPVVLGCAAASEDPLLLGPRALKADGAVFGVNAKATLVMHMMEQRSGRDAVLRAAHLITAPALDLLSPPIMEMAWQGPAITDDGAASASMAVDSSGGLPLAVPPVSDYQATALQGANGVCSKTFFALVNGDDEAAALSSADRADSSSGNAAATVWMEQWVYGSGVAALLCEWEWDKSKNEVHLTLTQKVVHGSNEAKEEKSGAFQGPILIRVVEVDEVVMDHRRVLGSELQINYTLKCQTSTKARDRRHRANAGGANFFAAQASSTGGADSDNVSSECPVLWIKVDPDYSWAREVVMRRQPFDSWVEQLGKDGDADARTGALKAIAEHPSAQEHPKRRKPAAALLADVVRGSSLPLGAGGDTACEEHSWAVRAEACGALSRWQTMHAPQTSVANLKGSWAGWEGLSKSLEDLFEDDRNSTPLPLGTRVVRCNTTPGGGAGAGDGDLADGVEDGSGSGGVQTYPSSFASANLHVCLLEAMSSVRAKNGATPLSAAETLLKALTCIDDDHVEPSATSAEQAAWSSSLALSSATRTVDTHEASASSNPFKKQRAGNQHHNEASAAVDTAMDTGYGIARVLVALGEVALFPEEVHAQNAEAWRQAALKQAVRLLRADRGFRHSHNAIVSAAALQAIATLTVQASSPPMPSPLAPATKTAASTSASAALSHHGSSGELYLRPWGESCHPDSMRLTALVGTVQQHAASGDAAVVLEALNWFLAQLFGESEGDSHTCPSSSDWLCLRAPTALAEWLSGAAGPGGVLGNEGQLLFADQYMPGLAGRSPGGACSKSFYSPAAAVLKPSQRQQQLARKCRDLVRGAVGYHTLLSAQLQPPPHPSVDPTPSYPVGAKAFCVRLWGLASSSPSTSANQPVRSALKDLWTSLFAYDVPPLMRPTSTTPAMGGDQATNAMGLVPQSWDDMPNWADKTVSNVFQNHARQVRKQDKHRATRGGGGWMDEKQGEADTQPAHRKVRLVVGGASATSSNPK